MPLTHPRQPEISIHALREEGDPVPSRQSTPPPLFLSTPSVRRATWVTAFTRPVLAISIHALREEGDT